MCAVVVADDQLSCCGCYAVAHTVAVLAVSAPNRTFVCMSECLGVGRWWRSLLKALTPTPRYATVFTGQERTINSLCVCLCVFVFLTDHARRIQRLPGLYSSIKQS